MHSMTDAAALLDCSIHTVRAWCRRRGIGEVVSRVRVLSDADIELLRTLVRPGPGCPLMVPGNQLARRRRDRRRGKKPSKSR